MRKRGAHYRRREPSTLLLPEQIRKLTQGMHAALTLLPLNLFNEEHAHDLAAFFNIAQIAASQRSNPSIEHIARASNDTIAALKQRADTQGAWIATDDERQVLIDGVREIDKYIRTLSSSAMTGAIVRAMAINDATPPGRLLQSIHTEPSRA